jgi:RNase P/RNase MRP subunit p30
MPQIITTSRLNDALKEIDKIKSKSKEERVIVLSQDDEFNRKVLESRKIDIFLINEELENKDYSKQRNSGLNEVLAELASKNNIKIGIGIEKILKKDKGEQAISLARLAQNILLCKKAKTELIIFSEEKLKDRRAIVSLLLTLGASTNLANKAVQESF